MPAGGPQEGKGCGGIVMTRSGFEGEERPSEAFAMASQPSGQSGFLHSLPGVDLGMYVARMHILSVGISVMAGSKEVQLSPSRASVFCSEKRPQMAVSWQLLPGIVQGEGSSKGGEGTRCGKEGKPRKERWEKEP